jgi:hypothetical protein
MVMTAKNLKFFFFIYRRTVAIRWTGIVNPILKSKYNYPCDIELLQSVID